MIPQDWISSRRSSPQALERRLGLLADELLAAMEPGDEIRSFRNSDRSWKMQCGRRGYVLIRQRRVVRVIVVAMS